LMCSVSSSTAGRFPPKTLVTLSKSISAMG
jgi:hypothetical protein